MPLDPTLKQLKLFAASLGWQGLKRWEHIREDNGESIVWYEAGNVDDAAHQCSLQINHSPVDQERIFAACVYAIRYRICSGWREFDLGAPNLDEELSQLRPSIEYANFQTPERRRAYRLLHPECVGFTWKKIRERGVPEQPFYDAAE